MARPSKSPAAGDTSSSTPADKAIPARPRPSRRLVAVAGVIGTALVAALAAAVITPERMDAIFQWFTPSSTPSPSPEVDYKRVVSPDGVFTLDIPASWLIANSIYNVTYAGAADTGTAVSAGVDPTDGRQPTEDGIYLAASLTAASRLELATADESEVQAVVDAAAIELDWSIDGCVRGASQLSGPDGWVTGVTPWDDCYSTKGLRLWEMYSVPPSRDFILGMQLQLSQETDEAVLAHIIGSLVIDESKIPAGAGESVLP